MLHRRNVIEKTFSGNLDQLDMRDGVDAARFVTGFIPARGMGVLDVGLSGLQAAGYAKDEEQELSRSVGGNVRRMAYRSRALRKKLREMDNSTISAATEAGVSASGGGIGALAGSFVPIPVLGTLGGAWIGSTVANTLYNEAVATQDQDAVAIFEQLDEMRQQSQRIPPVMAFAYIAANVPGYKGRLLENRLQAVTGTRQFHVALAQGKTQELERMMRDYDRVIRDYTHMPRDPANFSKTASEQYAELINNGRVDARALLFDSQRMPSLARIYNSPVRQRPVSLPTVPRHTGPAQQQDLLAIARNLARMGVTVSRDNNGQLQAIPTRKGGPSVSTT